MTAPIAPIGAIAPISATTSVAPASAAGAATGSSGVDFASALGKGMDAVTGAQANAENLAVQAATGQLTDPAQLTIATTQATLMTQLATTLQSKAVTAFNTIMGMQA
jgi:flagellar hook-basal body complex protein FliE